MAHCAGNYWFLFCWVVSHNLFRLSKEEQAFMAYVWIIAHQFFFFELTGNTGIKHFSSNGALPVLGEKYISVILQCIFINRKWKPICECVNKTFWKPTGNIQKYKIGIYYEKLSELRKKELLHSELPQICCRGLYVAFGQRFHTGPLYLLCKNWAVHSFLYSDP